jgi:hypothetical protein
MTDRLDMPEYVWRAELLAKVILTRRSDIEVRHPVRPWDLLVELLEGESHTGQVFAVEVGATLRPEGFGRADENGEVAVRAEWRHKLRVEVERAKDTPFPVCFVGFAMTTDQGYFAWIRRPVRDGTSEGLVTELPEHLFPFTNEVVDDIVTSVREWYRQRRHHAAAG